MRVSTFTAIAYRLLPEVILSTIPKVRTSFRPTCAASIAHLFQLRKSNIPVATEK
jgi:hypothetical protein